MRIQEMNTNTLVLVSQPWLTIIVLLVITSGLLGLSLSAFMDGETGLASILLIAAFMDGETGLASILRLPLSYAVARYSFFLPSSACVSIARPVWLRYPGAMFFENGQKRFHWLTSRIQRCCRQLGAESVIEGHMSRHLS
jgi:hypothetical protein